MDHDAVKHHAARARERLGITRDFTRSRSRDWAFPRGGVHQVVYAVQVVDHPTVVKIGQTTNWRVRRRAYADWNLRCGDGILAEVPFLITEEYIDLLALEAEVLSRARDRFMPYRGAEWFVGDIDEAARLIDEVMCEGGVSYVHGS